MRDLEALANAKSFDLAKQVLDRLKNETDTIQSRLAAVRDREREPTGEGQSGIAWRCRSGTGAGCRGGRYPVSREVGNAERNGSAESFARATFPHSRRPRLDDAGNGRSGSMPSRAGDGKLIYILLLTARSSEEQLVEGLKRARMTI